MFSRMKIVTRLFLGFALLVLGIVTLGVLGGRDAVRLSALTADIFEHPYAVSTAILNVRADVLIAQTMMTRLVHAPGPGELESTREMLHQQVVRVDKNMVVVRERYLGPAADVQRIEQALLDLRTARDQTFDLVRGGHRAEAVAQNDGRDNRLGEVVLANVVVVADFAAAKAASLKNQAEQEGRRTLEIIALMVLLIVSGGIALAYFVTRSVRASLRQSIVAVRSLIDGGAEKVRVAEAVGSGDLSVDIVASQPLRIDLNDLPEDESGALLAAAVQLSEVHAPSTTPSAR